MYQNSYANEVKGFKIMPIYQTNDHILLKIKEKNIDEIKPKLNKT